MKADPSVSTPAQYIAQLPEERRQSIQTLHDAIREAAPELKPFISGGMLGYGPYHYKYGSGREGDSAIVSLASQKNHISMYVCATKGDEYIAEKHKTRLGKVSVGRSCIRFKKLEDLNVPAAMEVVKEAAALMS